jgi:hypothetical protein
MRPAARAETTPCIQIRNALQPLEPRSGTRAQFPPRRASELPTLHANVTSGIDDCRLRAYAKIVTVQVWGRPPVCQFTEPPAP